MNSKQTMAKVSCKKRAKQIKRGHRCFSTSKGAFFSLGNRILFISRHWAQARTRRVGIHDGHQGTAQEGFCQGLQEVLRSPALQRGGLYPRSVPKVRQGILEHRAA